MPVLKGKFDGVSFRVPTIVVSLSDITAVLKRDVTVEEINKALTDASKGAFAGIIDVCDQPLVSSDFKGNPHSAIVDLAMTRVVGGKMIKVVAWYDNEWGYSNRLVEQAIIVAQNI